MVFVCRGSIKHLAKAMYFAALSSPVFALYTWMSRWKLGSMVRINGLFHLLRNGICWGYNPLIIPQKSNIDTKNCNFLRESPFPNHRLACWSPPRQPVPTSLVGSGYHNEPSNRNIEHHDVFIGAKNVLYKSHYTRESIIQECTNLSLISWDIQVLITKNFRYLKWRY